MSIYKRKNIWWVKYTDPSGVTIRRSTKTSNERLARELHDKLVYERWNVEKLDKKPDHIWDEACLRWIDEKTHKRSLSDDMAKIEALGDFRGISLSLLTKSFIEATVDQLDVTESTKNRYFSLIGAILSKCAKEWGWIDKSPALKRYREPKKRIRWLTRNEAKRLIDVLPSIVGNIAEFSLMTGLRQANVLNLKWNQIDMQRAVAWIHADQTKSGRPLGVPLNQTAITILQKQIGEHLEFVFVRDNGEKFNGISSKTWANALKKAGITDFRWHDLRHTWASWLVQAGVPLMELKELGGWESIEMVQRYAHLAPEHLHSSVTVLDRDEGTNWAHKEKHLSAKLAG